MISGYTEGAAGMKITWNIFWKFENYTIMKFPRSKIRVQPLRIIFSENFMLVALKRADYEFLEEISL